MPLKDPWAVVRSKKQVYIKLIRVSRASICGEPIYGYFDLEISRSHIHIYNLVYSARFQSLVPAQIVCLALTILTC